MVPRLPQLPSPELLNRTAEAAAGVISSGTEVLRLDAFELGRRRNPLESMMK
jgi:hypothetical protein